MTSFPYGRKGTSLPYLGSTKSLFLSSPSLSLALVPLEWGQAFSPLFYPATGILNYAQLSMKMSSDFRRKMSLIGLLLDPLLELSLTLWRSQEPFNTPYPWTSFLCRTDPCISQFNYLYTPSFPPGTIGGVITAANFWTLGIPEINSIDQNPN